MIFMGTSCTRDGVVLMNTSVYKDKKFKIKMKKKLKRGAFVKVKNCEEKVCLIEYEKNRVYVPKRTVYSKDYEVVTFVRESEIRLSPDLLSSNARYKNKASILAKYFGKKILIGTKAYLLKEEKVWAFVDLGDIHGWVLKDKLFKGDGVYFLSIKSNGLSLEFKGEWYKPYLSGERLFSVEKAFDGNNKTFSILEKDKVVTINIKNYHNSNNNYTFSYDNKKEIKYKNLSLPEELTLIHPFEKVFQTEKGIQFDFEGNVLKFKINKSRKKSIYFDGASIINTEKRD